MESPDLTPTPRDDAPFDAFLRAQVAATLPDDGFVARVLHVLPPTHAELQQAAAEQCARQRRRGWFCAGGALAGFAAMRLARLNWQATVDDLARLLETLLLGTINATAAFDPITVLLALGITAGCVAAVYWDKLKPRRLLR